jgi:hypothetical protein
MVGYNDFELLKHIALSFSVLTGVTILLYYESRFMRSEAEAKYHVEAICNGTVLSSSEHLRYIYFGSDYLHSSWLFLGYSISKGFQRIDGRVGTQTTFPLPLTSILK